MGVDGSRRLARRFAVRCCRKAAVGASLGMLAVPTEGLSYRTPAERRAARQRPPCRPHAGEQKG